MLELGDCAPAEHEKVGAIAAKNAGSVTIDLHVAACKLT
jgi:hypothetical protein